PRRTHPGNPGVFALTVYRLCGRRPPYAHLTEWKPVDAGGRGDLPDPWKSRRGGSRWRQVETGLRVHKLPRLLCGTLCDLRAFVVNSSLHLSRSASAVP